jgi:hypothetical protein
MEKMPFGGFSVGLHRPHQLAAMAEFWFLADWLSYSPDMNLLNFSTGSILQPKGQAMPHANLMMLCLSIAAEGDRLAAVYIRKTCCSFRPRR